jgi:hypothetical protein
MHTHNGLIGFFDILGYQNLLEKNEPEDIAQSVLNYLTSINATVTTTIKDIIDETTSETTLKDAAKEVLDSLKWIIFSDTILLTIPFESKDKYRTTKWLAFLTTCIHLQTEMFRNGLPVRGVINYGKFYLQDTCFAGRSIIEAYDLCNKLELAACILSPYAEAELKDIISKSNSFQTTKALVHEYLIPTKTGEFRYLVLSAHVYDIKDGNIMKQILSSFWGHNKDIPLSVQNKISNTEQWLNFIKIKKEELKNQT